MRGDIFQGDLVCLVGVDKSKMAAANSRWSRDSVFGRLLGTGPPRPFSVKSSEDWREKELEKDALDRYMFMIKTLEVDRLVGEVWLDGIQWHHGDSFLAISIGERENWNRGYGTDALRIILRYAFSELNLNRVSLNVFEYTCTISW